MNSADTPLATADLPENMPLTNRLDKMTIEQARWAIRNGDAWIAYLEATEGEVYQPKQEKVEVSDADKHNAIFAILEKVWLDVTDHKPLSKPKEACEWVATLRWALRFMPKTYEARRIIIENEITRWKEA